ncbi:MAG: DNA polymerase III subunit beta [Minisyncoccia bacterium]
MFISIQKKEFAEAVHTVARFAERRSATLPTLSGIAIVAGGDVIKLRATNLEVGIDLKVEGSIKSEGVVVIPSQVLREIAGSLVGDGLITIEYAGDTAVITSGAGKSTVKTLPSDDFPVIPIPNTSEISFSVAGSTLTSLIGSVVACASSSTVRPDLGSVFLSEAGGILKAVASDSFRLAEKKISVSGNIRPFTALIPAKNALDIMQTIPQTEITVTIDEHQCAFSWEKGMLSTRLVSATYPDYEQIIPKTFVGEATLLKKDLEAALRRTAVFSDTFQKVRLSLDQKAGNVTLSARNPDVGESSDSIRSSATGESVELSFNHRYLAAPLSLLASESLTLSSGGMGRPLVMKGSGDSSFLYLVMPMNQ